MPAMRPSSMRVNIAALPSSTQRELVLSRSLTTPGLPGPCARSPIYTRRTLCSQPLATPAALPQGAQPQRIEPDESCCVLLVVGALVVLEGHEAAGIERLVAFAAGDDDVALIELESHHALHLLLALVDQRLQHQPLWREPKSVVDELGVARHQLVLEVCGAAVERDRFDRPMGREQDGAPGGLIDPARLHADEAVFDEVDAADPVIAAELVEL